MERRSRTSCPGSGKTDWSDEKPANGIIIVRCGECGELVEARVDGTLGPTPAARRVRIMEHWPTGDKK